MKFRALLLLFVLSCCGCLHAARPSAEPDWDRLSAIRRTEDRDIPIRGPRWLDDPAQARLIAESRNSGILIHFVRTGDSFSQRMKYGTLQDPSLWDHLGQYTLVEINVDRHPETAFDHQVREVPTLLWMDAEGRELHRTTGWLSPEDLRAFFERIRNPEVPVLPPDLAALIQRLSADPRNREQMIEALEHLRRDHAGANLRQALRQLDPMPVGTWVDLLDHPSLTIRLGALELLEELSENSFDFDPWAPPDTQAVMLNRWREWAGNFDGAPPRGRAPLTQSQLHGAVRDLDSESGAHVHRATRTLELGGKDLLPHLEAAMEEMQLSPRQLQRLDDILLTLRIAALGRPDPAGVAFRLRRGPLDSRMRFLREFTHHGTQALPVLTPFLDDPEILIRETALESALQAGGNQALPLVLPRLREEPNPDIALVAMRHLAKLSSPEATAWLKTQLESDREDRILGALQAMQSGSHDALAPQALSLLEDPRWRVRATAATTLGAIRHQPALSVLLKAARDPEAFTRTAALTACLNILRDKDKRAELLNTWYRENPEDFEILLRVACDKRVTLPPALMEDAAELDKPDLLNFLRVILDCGALSVPVALEYAENPDADIRATALRILAAEGLRTTHFRQKTDSEQMLVTALLESGPELRRVLLNRIRLPDPDDQLNPFGSFEPYIPEGAETEGETSDELDELLGAFSDSAEPAPTSPPPADPLDDLLSAFTEPKSDAAEAGGADLEDALIDLFRNAEEEDIRIAAASLLAQLGHTPAIERIIRQPDSLSPDRIRQLLDRLQASPDGPPLALALRNDPRPEVKTMALETLARHAPLDFLPLLNSVDDPSGIPLVDLPLLSWSFRSGLDSLNAGGARPFIQSWLEEKPDDTPAATVRKKIAIQLAVRHRNSRWIPLLRKMTEDTANDPELRAFAWIGLASNQRKLSEAEQETLLEDSAAKVRAVLPFLQIRSNDKSWQIGSLNGDEWIVESRQVQNGWNLPLREDRELAQLRELQKDSSPLVRFLAGMSLYTNHKDLSDPDRWLQDFPQPKANTWLTRMTAGILRPNPSSALRTPELATWLTHQFGREYMSRLPSPKMVDVGSSTLPAGDETESGSEPPETPAAPPVVLYFYSEGCGDCERVQAFLEAIQQDIPELDIRAMDITDPDAEDLYAAVYRKFGLPLTGVGLTPMLAGAHQAAAGGDDLTFDRVSEIVTSSLDGSGDSWIPALSAAEPLPLPDLELPPPAAESESVTAETASDPGPAAKGPTREPAVPLQGLLLLLAPAMVLLTLPRPEIRRLGPALLICVVAGSLLPLTLAVQVAAVFAMLLPPLRILRQSRERADTQSTLSTHIRNPERGLCNWDLLTVALLLLLIGFSLPLHQWADALGRLSGAQWMISGLLLVTSALNAVKILPLRVRLFTSLALTVFLLVEILRIAF